MAATAEEVSASRPGDQLVDPATVVMDRGFDLAHPPAAVWPWLVQLGKRRAGWYLPRPVERLVPRGRRALRHVDPRWQGLAVGDVIPDYGGRDATFEVAELVPASHLVHTSRRGGTSVSWTLHLSPYDGGRSTRVHLRLRLGPVRHVRVAETVGGAFDALTILGLAAGLAERLDEGVDR
ncbi:hypothetical protein ETU37_19235 [Nocardioides iriomotensis]|uniref:SRPBCC family protein n=1 Tax=Nocardioides iriomotensis TaxID=715784 RepID=A0A4Q5IYN6_9ACTN|nr:hypothetical protein ETU37_19235 [Nocardioides iriomotensis]